MGLFGQSDPKIDLLQASQDNLALMQKNLECMIELGKNMQNEQIAADEEITAEAMKRAAYALNCCTVSVSQIIDYDDVYILEQEYENILNNLNLEVMPKDEALLDILKQLLNTITFFRIQEGDKAMLDKEYQHRMKNAIWSAVPNIGMIVAGGNWATAAVSLVSQVGIGYMNYRREKAQNQLDLEKQKWQLMRSAIEQFNGLRRELFDTAWRLADKYNFPDTYRITERQISIYNRILMEPDPLKRYERLAYVQDKFIAYPPFTYHLASAASTVALSIDGRYPVKLKALCAKVAEEKFQEYIDATKANLFREDQIRATCALEYFNLLLTQGNVDKKRLGELLHIALEAAGNAYDVLEMCAFAYAQLDMPVEAAKILRMLVNEDYNAVVNAQLLSSLYVRQYLLSPTEEILIEYETLASRVDRVYLFPMPQNLTSGYQYDTLENEFFACQKRNLLAKYAFVIKAFVEKYTIRFNKAIPAANAKTEYSNEYYSNDVEAIQQRAHDVLALFEKGKHEEYIGRLHFVTQDMFAVLNDMCMALDRLPMVNRHTVLQCVKDKLTEKSNVFVKLQKKISERLVKPDDIRTLFGLSFEVFTEDAFKAVVESIKYQVCCIESMPEVADAESSLRAFCNAEGIEMPEPRTSSQTTSTDIVIYNNVAEITIDLLGQKAADYQREMGRIKKMEDCIRNTLRNKHLNKEGSSKIKFYIKETHEYDEYLRRNKDHLSKISWNILAIINDTSAYDEDWLLTSNGIRRFHRTLFSKTVGALTPYSSIRSNGKGYLVLRDCVIDCERINLALLAELIQKLAIIEKEFAASASERVVLPEGTDGGMALRLSTSLMEDAAIV